MRYASLGPIAIYLPERVEDNSLLDREFPDWHVADWVYEKTGVRARHIAAPDQCASDLGVAAAEKLLRRHNIDRESIDFLLFCTQTPDLPLPTTACLMQDRLGLPTTTGALDYNLGCSGFVYGLALADGLIASGAARRILLVTAETYSKYIDPADRSLRTIFGDGAAAALVDVSDEPSLGPFIFGTDGSRANTLMVTRGGMRRSDQALQPSKRHRWASSLFMDGPELIKATLELLPPTVDRLLAEARLSRDDVDLYLMHQATALMLTHLREQLSLTSERMPIDLDGYGNTVSSTIPILVHDLRASGQLRPGKRSLLAGYGVGLSWATCMWTETWQQSQASAVESARRKAA